MDPKLIARRDLAQCVLQMAARAAEIDEKAIQCVLLTLAGSIAGDVDDELAYVCGDFAREQLEAEDIDPTEMDENEE